MTMGSGSCQALKYESSKTFDYVMEESKRIVALKNSKKRTVRFVFLANSSLLLITIRATE